MEVENTEAADYSGLSLEEKVLHKNWKARCDGYEQLKSEIPSHIHDPSFISLCGSFITKLTSDSNPNCLDLGLDSSILFFELCDNAWASCDQEKVLNNIIDKTFGARQSSLQRGKALMLKIIETNDPYQVSNFLLTKIGDKRPKVPPTCIDLLTEGIILFGANKYPIKDILKSILPIFSSSNSSARESAMTLIVELYKWIGLAPLQPLLDGLRPAQRSDFDKLVQSQPQMTPVPSLGLKKDRLSGSVLSEPEAPKLEARDLVDELDLSKKIKGSEFSTLVGSDKWADQVQGLDWLIQVIGNTPKFKYNSSISDTLNTLHLLLKNGHVQVQIKCLRLISLFADGCRAKVSSEMRNLLSTVISRSKEKKIVEEVQSCLVVIFQYVVNIDLVLDDFLEFMISRKNPPHSKICLCSVLISLFEKHVNLQGDSPKLIFQSLITMSDDSDGKVREICIIALQKFRESFKTKAPINQLIENLNLGNPKLYRKVTQEAAAEKTSSIPEISFKDGLLSQIQTSLKSEPLKLQKAVKGPDRNDMVKTSNVTTSSEGPTRKIAPSSTSEKEDNDLATEVSLSIEDCIANISECLANDWDRISRNLSSSKWQEKVEGLTEIQSNSSRVALHVESIFIIYSNFGIWKSSNVNVVKTAVESFTCLVREVSSVSKAITFSLINVLLEKIADKKLQAPIESLLQEIISKFDSKLLFKKILALLSNAKSPVVHQALLVWLKNSSEGLRLSLIPVQSFGQICLKELENKNPAVRTAALDLIKLLYSRIGPPFSSVLLAKDVSAQIKSLLELELGKVECVSTSLDQDLGDLGSEIPRKDITEYLEKSTFNDLNCLEGKDSWQVRKSGIEKISDACNRSGYYLEFNKVATEAVKHLKARLNDTQSNLKPLAMQTIANLISSFSSDKILKCLKAVAQPILTGLTDNKKPMRDATISALETIISLHGKKVEEGIFNYIVLSSSEILHSSIGRLELLSWINSHLQLCHGDFSDLTQPLLSALQDKTSQVRHECETFLTFLVAHKLISKATFDKYLRDLPPATKRSIQNAIDRILSGAEVETPTVKESLSEEVPYSADVRSAVNSITTSAPVQTSFSRTIRREDWLKWPNFPSLPSMYDLSILKNKWKKDYDSFTRLTADMQDVVLFAAEIASLSSEEVSSQADYIFRWASYHLANTRDVNKLTSVCQTISLTLQRMANDISENELILFFPFLLGKLSLIFREDGKISEVMDLLNEISLRSGARNFLHIIFSTLGVLEDSKSRLVLWNFLLSATPKLDVALTEDDFSWFIFLKNHKILLEEKMHCSEFLQQLELKNGSASLQHLIGKIKEILNYQKAPTTVNNKKTIETFDIGPVNFDTLIEDLMVVVSLSEKISTSKVKEILDKTRIIVSTPPYDVDKGRSHRRLRDFLDVFRQMLSNYSKYDDSLIFCCLSLFHFVEKEIPEFLWSLNHFELKMIISSVLILFESVNPEKDHLVKPTKLVLLSLCEYTNPLVYLTVLIELLVSRKIPVFVGIRLSLLTIAKGTQAQDRVSDEQLPLLMIQLESLVAVDSELHVQFCKSVLNWCVSCFGSEKVEGITSNSLLIENLKLIVSFSDKGLERANNGEQVVDIIHEITFSKDKQTAITKLYEFKRNNPDVDVNFYLSKLSAPFRKYVVDVFSKLEETENLNNLNTGNEEAVAEISPTSSEALRIIENLKARPPSYRPQSDTKSSFSVGSPIAARNERIRDSLSELSKNLDLQTSLNSSKASSSFSETLEERLVRLESLN